MPTRNAVGMAGVGQCIAVCDRMARTPPPADNDKADLPVDVSSAAKAAATATFEGALAALEGVVARLEKGDLTLEQSLVAYEDGIRLVHAAKGKLDGMQTRLEQLLDDGSTKSMRKQSDSTQADG